MVHPDAAEASSLLLVLHGSDSDAARFRELSGHTFDRLVADGVVVAYAEAYGGVWNDARLGTRSPARERAWTTWSSSRRWSPGSVEEYAVPADRVFAAGFSNGGQMVIRLVVQAPELIAGAAVISSNHPAPENVLPEMVDLDRHQPMPVLTISGTRDPIVPFDGGVASLWGADPRRTGAVVSGLGGPVRGPQRNHRTSDLTSGHDETDGDHPHPLAPGRGARPVDFYAIEGGGHTVPNRDHDASARPRPDAARPRRWRAGAGLLRTGGSQR